MAASILNDMVDSGSELMYHPKLRQVFEENLIYLRKRPTTTITAIKDIVAYQCEGDFIKVLNYLEIKPELHWLIMRLNGYTSPMEYTSDRQEVILPHADDVSGIIKTFRVSNKK